MKKKESWYLAFVFILLYTPIFYLMAYSFNSGGDMQGFEHITLNYYKELFSDDRLLKIVMDTFLLAFLSSFIATLIGVFGAIAIGRLKVKTKHRLLEMNNMLMVSPDVIIGASFLILFTAIGMKLGFVSVLLSHIAFSIPIVVLMVLPKVEEMPQSLIDAAADLGATPWMALWHVMLPYLTSSIIAGFFMAFTYSLDDFAVTFFVTGNGFTTLAVEIYSRARQGISLEINALSTLIFLFSLLLVLGYYYLSKDNKKKEAH